MRGAWCVTAAAIATVSTILVGQPVTLAAHSSATPCALVSSTYLSPRIWGAFTRIHDETDRTSPFATFAMSSAHRSALITDFQISRMHGFVTTLVLHGKYRAENDAYARSLGYTPGSIPLVPLVGTIVYDHPGVLEVYETHWLWRSPRGASAQMHSIRGSGKGEVIRQMSLRVGDDSYAYVVRPTESDGLHEWSVGIAIQVRTTVVTLMLRGGRQLPSIDIKKVAHQILIRMGRCDKVTLDSVFTEGEMTLGRSPGPSCAPRL